MPANRLRSIAPNRRNAYESIKKSVGGNKSVAAAIANAGRTKAGRSAMARKAAKTRKGR